MRLVAPISQGCSENQMCKNGRGLCPAGAVWPLGAFLRSRTPRLSLSPGGLSEQTSGPRAWAIWNCWSLGYRQRAQGRAWPSGKLKFLLQAELLPLPLEHLGTFSPDTSRERAVAWLGSRKVSKGKTHQFADTKRHTKSKYAMKMVKTGKVLAVLISLIYSNACTN